MCVSIWDLKIPKNVAERLEKHANINTIEDLVSKREYEIKLLRNLGPKSFKILRLALIEEGLSFGMRVEGYEESVVDLNNEADALVSNAVLTLKKANNEAAMLRSRAMDGMKVLKKIRG